MSTVLAHSGLAAGSHDTLVFLPIVILALGIAFVVGAVNDKVDAKPRNPASVQLPSRHQMPLYHLHTQIRSAKRLATPQAEDDSGTPPERPKRKRSSSAPKLVVHQ